jgi:hypothetical protein
LLQDASEGEASFSYDVLWPPSTSCTWREANSVILESATFCGRLEQMFWVHTWPADNCDGLHSGLLGARALTPPQRSSQVLTQRCQRAEAERDVLMRSSEAAAQRRRQVCRGDRYGCLCLALRLSVPSCLLWLRLGRHCKTFHVLKWTSQGSLVDYAAFRYVGDQLVQTGPLTCKSCRRFPPH